jgi:hydroxymethylglutaryl-CoA reductase
MAAARAWPRSGNVWKFWAASAGAKVNKFAEIVAGAVLAGEISLAAAISSSDWVSSHEQYGRNR